MSSQCCCKPSIDFNDFRWTDGYSGYNAACAQNNMTSVGCWDHARRKFKDAQSAQPTKKNNNKLTKADMALSLINKLYRIEREVKESSTAQKYQIRQEKSLPHTRN